MLCANKMWYWRCLRAKWAKANEFEPLQIDHHYWLTFQLSWVWLWVCVGQVTHTHITRINSTVFWSICVAKLVQLIRNIKKISFQPDNKNNNDKKVINFSLGRMLLMHSNNNNSFNRTSHTKNDGEKITKCSMELQQNYQHVLFLYKIAWFCGQVY